MSWTGEKAGQETVKSDKSWASYNDYGGAAMMGGFGATLDQRGEEIELVNVQ